MADGFGDFGTIATIITVLATGAAAAWWAHRALAKHERSHDDLEKVPAAVDDIREKVNLLVLAEVGRDTSFLDKVKLLGKPSASGNPYDPRRRADLLARLDHGNLNVEEAQELQGYLQEDLQRIQAEDAGSSVAGAVVALLVVLGALAALAYLLSRKK